MKIAFYKGPGTIFDRMIGFYTASKYSHVELIDDMGNWYTSSPRDGGVVIGRIFPTESHWDIYDIDINERLVVKFFHREMGKKYDWLGILLSQLFKMDIHNRNRWFCSEIVHGALIEAGMSKIHTKASNKYDPGRLFNLLVSIGEIYKWPK